jgi:hypothetical protein
MSVGAVLAGQDHDAFGRRRAQPRVAVNGMDAGAAQLADIVDG